MYIKLFDIKDKIATPTAHCYTFKWLKDIIDAYPDSYLKIFAYLQYMYSWNPDDNPFLNIKEEEREETVLTYIAADFSTEDELIQEASENCKKLFELPAYRTWKAIKGALQRLEEFVSTQKITAGKDGSGTFILSAAEKLPGLNKSFNQAYQSYMDDVRVQVRGDKFSSQV